MSHQNKREIITQRERQRQESGEAKKLSDAGLVKPRVFIWRDAVTAEPFTIIGAAVVVVCRLRLLVGIS